MTIIHGFFGKLLYLDTFFHQDTYLISYFFNSLFRYAGLRKLLLTGLIAGNFAQIRQRPGYSEKPLENQP